MTWDEEQIERQLQASKEIRAATDRVADEDAFPPLDTSRRVPAEFAGPTGIIHSPRQLTPEELERLRERKLGRAKKIEEKDRMKKEQELLDAIDDSEYRVKIARRVIKGWGATTVTSFGLTFIPIQTLQVIGILSFLACLGLLLGTAIIMIIGFVYSDRPKNPWNQLRLTRREYTNYILRQEMRENDSS